MNKTILITGTSTGIGRTCALYFDEIGFTVYAGVRRSEDAKDLEKDASERLRPIILDVSDESSIVEAAKKIESETGGQLDGLINNAGIGLGGALEVTPSKEIYKLMNVNVIGLMVVTKIFLPMLRKSTGRIINIGSTSAYLAFPGISIYAASKFAVRAFTDALRLELHHLGIKVILVSPGAIESAIWDKGAAYRKALRENLDPEMEDLYGSLRRFGDSLYTDLKRIPATDVAEVAAKALTHKHPRRYYIVGKDAKGARKATYLPTAFLDRVILKRIEKFAQT
jgi:short-subunit dehydrogenase